jgi:hypothetical protein
LAGGKSNHFRDLTVLAILAAESNEKEEGKVKQRHGEEASKELPKLTKPNNTPLGYYIS